MREEHSDARTVTVGIDGSEGSAVALRWAIEHADHLGEVTPVMTFVSGPFEYGFGTVAGASGTGEPYRSEAVLRLRDFLEERAPDLADAGRVIEHRAGPGLVEAAALSELLVVGTRGWSGRADLSVGSVGAYCARHSTVPVALIPHDVPPTHGHLTVVVGFDGSPNSLIALGWTLTHLRPSAEVVVVRGVAGGKVAGEASPLASDVTEEVAGAELERDVAELLADLADPPTVHLRVVEGDPRLALPAAAHGADVLVIGARGRGVIDRLLLGSVASALTHHPALPTIVVPPRSVRHPV